MLLVFVCCTVKTEKLNIKTKTKIKPKTYHLIPTHGRMQECTHACKQTCVHACTHTRTWLGDMMNGRSRRQPPHLVHRHTRMQHDSTATSTISTCMAAVQWQRLVIECLCCFSLVRRHATPNRASRWIVDHVQHMRSEQLNPRSPNLTCRAAVQWQRLECNRLSWCCGWWSWHVWPWVMLNNLSVASDDFNINFIFW